MTTRSEFKEKSACADKYAPAPECISCPQCGEELEIWSDEEDATCSRCGRHIQR